MIHIVFGRSAEGSLNLALGGGNHRIIGFPIDFALGPITNILEKSGIEHYFKWLESTFHTMWSRPEEDELAYKKALQNFSEIKNDEQITIWTCENAREQIGLRICCYLLKNKEVILNVVNTYKAMNDSTRNLNIEIRSTGECNAKQLAHYYEYFLCPTSRKTKGILEQDGEELIQNNSVVRSWKNGEISHELESKYDSFIMDCAEKIHHEMVDSEFIYAARVIGEVVGQSEQSLSDAWIEYRIRTLIHSGYLKYQGDLQSSRMYKIKVVA